MNIISYGENDFENTYLDTDKIISLSLKQKNQI
jgi:hypothetical protein